jgi:hypothetical protein
MNRHLFSKAIVTTSILLLASAMPAQTTEATPANPGTSKVRIVRLSQVRGAVDIDRHIDRGFEPAIANLPVVESSQIRTGVGIAEIEFEDNSSLRIAPNSMVEFPRLDRESTGATASSIHLIRGTAYVSLVKPQNGKAPANHVELMFGMRKLDLDPSTHIRLELDGTEAKLAVLDGAVHIQDGNGMTIIPKKKTAVFQIFTESEPAIAKDITTTPFDAWDHNAASYHSNVAALSAVSSPYAYGSNDMLYYGSFMNAGCGSMWRPYFASASWDPFSNGTWAYYPSSGYSWVSPYPWAWTPYHSGSWSYCQGAGWGWMPGGDWYGLNNVAALNPIGGGSNLARIPHSPLHAPLPHTPAMVPVNTKPIPSSEMASGSSFLFRKDSAGMGIPRDTLGRLDKFSRDAISHGTAKTPIYISMPQANRSNGALSTSESMGASMHRGYAPSAGTSMSSGDPSGSSFGGGSGRGGGGIGGGGGRVSAGPAPTAAPSMPAPSAGRK